MNLKEISDNEKRAAIDQKTKQIISLLGVRKSFKLLNQLAGSIKIYKYVFQKSNRNNEHFMDVDYRNKNDYYLNALYVGLTRNPGLEVTDSVVYKHLLTHSIAEAEIVMCESKSSHMKHLANLVKLGKFYYLFDTTLERATHEDDAWENYTGTLCCAALGKNDDYFKMVRMIGCLPEDMTQDLKPLPENIAEESMSTTLINQINKELPDYSNTVDSIDFKTMYGSQKKNNPSKEDDGR